MSAKKLIAIIAGGILAFVLIFALWIGGSVLLYEKGISSGTWLYYLIMGIIVLLHPLIAKCLDISYRKRSPFSNDDVKIPGWLFLFTYVGLVIMCFPVSHFEYVLNIIFAIVEMLFGYKRRLFYLVVGFISFIPVFIALLVCVFVIERSFGAPQKTRSIIVMKSAVFIGVTWGVSMLLGFIAHRAVVAEGLYN